MQLWVSLNSVSGRGLLTLYQSSYKNFKGRFVKFRPSANNPTLLEGFPLYWALNPTSQIARRMEDLNPHKRGVCDFFENLGVVFETPLDIEA